MADTTRNKTGVTDFLLSWDRLGFRLLVFGGLALMWVLQGRLFAQPWPDLIRAEFGALLPWAFLAPLVLSLDGRIRSRRMGLARTLAAHLGAMALVYVPYWAMLRTIGFVWTCVASGWDPSHLRLFLPTRLNLLGGFLNVPFVYLLIILGAEAMQHAQARRDEELQAARLAGQLSDARLALLQRQLHPHFLFNALQAISTLLHRDPQTADRLLVRLSTLLRAMLDDASGQMLTLRTELDLVRRFVEIEQVRFGDRLAVVWRVDESVLDVSVPSLVVLPFVENAIRHGLSARVGAGRLAISAVPDAGSVLVTVEDDGAGATLPLRPGVGIGNTRGRLDAIYGNRARLEFDTRPNGGFRATIRIPREEQAA